jgi:hypothetical protein
MYDDVGFSRLVMNTDLANVPDVTHDFKDYVEPLTQEQMEKLKAPYSE